MRGAHNYCLWEWHPCHDFLRFSETVEIRRSLPQAPIATQATE